MHIYIYIISKRVLRWSSSNFTTALIMMYHCFTHAFLLRYRFQALAKGAMALISLLIFPLLFCSLETLAKHAMELIKSPAMRTLRRLMTVRILPAASLLMLYYCFTHALRKLHCCFTPVS